MFYAHHTHTHTVVIDQTLRGLLLFFPLSLYLRHSHRLCTRMTSEDRWEQRTDSRGPIVPIEKCPRTVWPYKPTHTTHTVLCKVYTEALHCSPLLFPLLLDLNFFRHLPLDLYTFFNRGHLLTITANRGPIVPLCYKSSVYPLHIHTHTHTHKLVNTGKRGSSHCSSFVYTFSQHLSYVLYTFGKRGPFSNWGPYCSFCYKSPVWMPKQTHTHTVLFYIHCVDILLFFKPLPFPLKIVFGGGFRLSLSS